MKKIKNSRFRETRQRKIEYIDLDIFVECRIKTVILTIQRFDCHTRYLLKIKSEPMPMGYFKAEFKNPLFEKRALENPMFFQVLNKSINPQGSSSPSASKTSRQNNMMIFLPLETHSTPTSGPLAHFCNIIVQKLRSRSHISTFPMNYVDRILTLPHADNR